MSSNEIVLQRLYNEYISGDQLALVKIFNVIRGALNLNIYYDPSHAREYCDFEQIAFTAVWEAVETFDKGKGSTITSWILTIVKQRLSREVRRITREHTEGDLHSHDLISESKPDEEPDTLIYQQACNPDPFLGMKTFGGEDDFYAYVEEVEVHLARMNLKLAKVFVIKLVWPNIDRKSLASIMSVSRMSISKYFKLMRRVMESIYEQHNRDRVE